MRVFDRIEKQAIDRRDWQLWVLALFVILILAGGSALLMYPTVFEAPETVSGPTLRRIFFAFCALCLLLVGYLFDRQMLIRQLRRKLAEEERRISSLREQASADLLTTLPGVEHFQDRLAMEFRRATITRGSLSLLMVGLKPAAQLRPGEVSMAYADAAKAIIRKLRGEDSIYLMRSGVFSVILPGVSGNDANRIRDRLVAGLADASGANERLAFEVQIVNYPEHVESARDMERVAITFLADKAAETQARTEVT